MRQIILDTETTGLDPAQGHRIIEVAAVEMVNRRLTGNHFHRYVNPGREIDLGAMQVHGITNEFLLDKPRFSDIVSEFLDFVRGAELIIHNAPFDVGFLDHEFRLVACGCIGDHCAPITDTLVMAKELHPGQKNNLDALCRRYQVDNSTRTLHGALLDAELLAEVYLAMTRGQETLSIEVAPVNQGLAMGTTEIVIQRELVVARATEEELAAHLAYLEELDKAAGGHCIWRD